MLMLMPLSIFLSADKCIEAIADSSHCAIACLYTQSNDFFHVNSSNLAL